MSPARPPGREAKTGALPGTQYARVADLQNPFDPVGLTVEPRLLRPSSEARHASEKRLTENSRAPPWP